MSDRDATTYDDHRLAVLGAIASVGPANPRDPYRWRSQVNDMIPFVASMLSPGSKQIERAAHVANADIIIGVYEGAQLEADTNRLVVSFHGERGSSETETIRTDRVDSATGRTMKERLDRLQSGQRLLIFKHIEKKSSGSGTVRMLVHFDTLFTPKEQLNPSSATASPAPRESPSRPSPSPADGEGAVDDPVLEAFQRLPGPVKAAVAKRCRAENIQIPRPADEDVDRFITIINEENK